MGEPKPLTANMCSGDGPLFGKEFNHADSLRLRSSLVQIIEELKQRRRNDVENEERLKTLLQEKYELEREKDAIASKMNFVIEEHKKEMLELERNHGEKTRYQEEEVKHNKVYRECLEAELKSLKDEIRNVQLKNFALEKNLRDETRKLQLESEASEKHLVQLSHVEQEFRNIKEQCKQLTETDLAFLRRQEIEVDPTQKISDPTLCYPVGYFDTREVGIKNETAV